jgi:hypothetical protein
MESEMERELESELERRQLLRLGKKGVYTLW